MQVEKTFHFSSSIAGLCLMIISKPVKRGRYVRLALATVWRRPLWVPVQVPTQIPEVRRSLLAMTSWSASNKIGGRVKRNRPLWDVTVILSWSSFAILAYQFRLFPSTAKNTVALPDSLYLCPDALLNASPELQFVSPRCRRHWRRYCCSPSRWNEIGDPNWIWDASIPSMMSTQSINGFPRSFSLLTLLDTRLSGSVGFVFCQVWSDLVPLQSSLDVLSGRSLAEWAF